mmetsp:Transcript_39535/g.88768  ORF Transcript_39535/g.88768 Transcript_39535/m.88768 type:complete len:699 (+) Transcript_39535:21-2117(+)
MAVVDPPPGLGHTNGFKQRYRELRAARADGLDPAWRRTATLSNMTEVARGVRSPEFDRRRSSEVPNDYLLSVQSRSVRSGQARQWAEHRDLRFGTVRILDDTMVAMNQVIAFVSRVVYRHLRSTGPGCHRRFEEAQYKPGCSKCILRWLPSWMRLAQVPVQVTCIFEFVHMIASRCGLPPEILVVSLAYLDRLLAAPDPRTGDRLTSLTRTSWRPLVAVSLLLASKVWEDCCMWNFELAECVGYTGEGVYRLESAALNLLRWNVALPAATFAPYYFAVQSVLHGEDLARDPGLHSSFTARLSSERRSNLNLKASQLALNIAPGRGVGRIDEEPGWQAGSEIHLDGGSPRQMEELRQVVSVAGEFKVEGILGVGRIAEVYAATEKATAAAVALKVLPAGPVAQCPLRLELRQLLKHLRHPNLLCYREFLLEVPTNRVVAVVDLLQGPDLFGWLVRRQQQMQVGGPPICEEGVRDIFGQVLGAAQFLHGYVPRVTHRDIKPEKLQFVSNGESQLKLLGCCTAVIGGSPDAAGTRAVGTPLYAAPEAARSTSPEVDAYSIGVILHLCLSSRFPHDDVAPRAPVKLVGTAWTRITGSGRDLVRRLLAMDPKKRISCASALRHPWFSVVNGGGLRRMKEPLALQDFRSHQALSRSSTQWQVAQAMEIPESGRPPQRSPPSLMQMQRFSSSTVEGDHSSPLLLS